MIKPLKSISLCCMLIISAFSAQQKYIVNYKNLYNYIMDNFPGKLSDVYIEVIKPHGNKKCRTSRYAKVFKKQEKFFLDVIKTIDSYLKNTPMNKKRRCVYQIILDSLKKAQGYVRRLFDIKVKWSGCSITAQKANNRFLAIWEKLFYTFNRKTKTKGALFSLHKRVALEDLPLHESNSSCIKNAPKMFCEFVGFFLYRTNIIFCQGKGAHCRDREVNLNNIVSGLYERFLKEYHGFDEFCRVPIIIDYFEESENNIQQNRDDINAKGEHSD